MLAHISRLTQYKQKMAQPAYTLAKCYLGRVGIFTHDNLPKRNWMEA